MFMPPDWLAKLNKDVGESIMLRALSLLIVVASTLSGGARAIEGMGNPWETIDDAVCAGLKLADFSTDVGAAVSITSAGRVPDTKDLPGYCRVVATIAPMNNVEIRLPISGWNGRVLMAGCGGLCGAVQMERTDDALARKYAVAHTDMGHAEADMAFADDPQLLEDFAHRSTHVATVLLKAVTKAYYNRPHEHAYYRGCSTGGRQGLTAALMYPDDYDGIIAGAPAAGPAVPNIVWALKANTRADGSSILDTAAITILHKAVLGACDMDDGVKDGIVSHPPSCAFDPASIACSKTKPGECLTPEQVEAAKKIYAGVPNPDGTKYASQGYSKGGELGWLRTLVRTDKPAGMEGVARNYLRRFTDVPNPPQTLGDLDFTKTPVRLVAVDALPSLGADGKRMVAFEKAGGKLLLYHSWSDDSLTPATAIDVYSTHERAMGGKERLDPFFRLFIIPGMFHCRGGDGPDAVDFLSAMESWVEKKNAPEKLIAFKAKQKPPVDALHRFPLPPDQVVFSRPLYPYPASTKFSGRGDAANASTWVKN
jgi:pimeloyl-ACP methyl ester carboxylesterase